MDWMHWGLVLAVGFVAGTAGASLYIRWGALRRVVAPRWTHLRRYLASALAAIPWRRKRQAQTRVHAAKTVITEDSLVLIPDGRPWPLGAALQLLELAWRWQVVHGTNLPLRARQGEGAYVWRPPLPVRTLSDQQGAEAER